MDLTIKVMEGISGMFTDWQEADSFFSMVLGSLTNPVLSLQKKSINMKNVLVAILLTAFVGSGYIAKAAQLTAVVVKDDDKDKKEKKSCEKKSSCCKMKAGEAKACAGMAKEEASASAVAAPASADAKPACQGEKKACCKKKTSCSSDKEKSSIGAIN